jgi:hypothetical protein
MTSIRAFVGAAALALAGVTAVAPAQAAGIETGILTCNEAGGWGFVFGSSHALHCTFTRNDQRIERYEGQISKFGVDIGYVQGGVIVWAVFAPTAIEVPGALAGAYGGATAGASLLVGANANALLGGSTNSIALQPLSVGSSTGINIAAGIAQITLSHVP